MFARSAPRLVYTGTSGFSPVEASFYRTLAMFGILRPPKFAQGFSYLFPNLGGRVLGIQQAFKFKQVHLEDLRCPQSVARFRGWIIHDLYQMPKRFCSSLGKLIW